jgi:hypothetical protein
VRVGVRTDVEGDELLQPEITAEASTTGKTRASFMMDVPGGLMTCVAEIRSQLKFRT